MDTVQIKPSRSYIGSEPKDIIFRPVYLNALKLREVEAILFKIRCIIINSISNEIRGTFIIDNSPCIIHSGTDMK